MGGGHRSSMRTKGQSTPTSHTHGEAASRNGNIMRGTPMKVVKIPL